MQKLAESVQKNAEKWQPEKSWMAPLGAIQLFFKKLIADIHEIDTGLKIPGVNDEGLLKEKVREFKGQIDAVKSKVNDLDKDAGPGHGCASVTSPGKVISLRQGHRNYPWPDEMKGFLKMAE